MRDAIWGDGFADDDVGMVMSVRDWDAVAGDELIRFFPRLAARPGCVPRDVIPPLERALEVLRQACARPSTPAVARLVRYIATGGTTDDGGAGGSDPHGPVTRLVDVLAALREGDLSSFDEARATRFAFEAAIHPAYLWPEAAVLCEKLTCAGWLGIVARGRAAFVPVDVADYLGDVLRVDRNGRIILADPDLAGLVGERIDLPALARAISRRSTDPSVLVRRGRAAVPFWRRGNRAMPLGRVHVDVLADRMAGPRAASGMLEG